MAFGYCWPLAEPANWLKWRLAQWSAARLPFTRLTWMCGTTAPFRDRIDDLPPEWAEIDILVNNAGLSRGLDKLYMGRIEDWEEMIDTNVKGLLYVTRAVVPGMVVRGHGHVINLGSTAGEMTYPNGAVYCATQGGRAGHQ